MIRTLIKDVGKKTGETIEIRGRIFNVRRLSNVSFALIRDYTGEIQVVFERAIDENIGDSIRITGVVKEDKRAKSGYEISGKEIEPYAKSQGELPLDLSKPQLNLQLTTLLDNRVVTLRHPKVQAIFKLYDILLEAYETEMRKLGFTEVKTPKLLGAASEGGANFFKVSYFEKEAYLAQSPQFYKQIMVGVFERVFEIGSTFRAEPHFTTRHINEYISLDAELGYIDSVGDVMTMLNKVLKGVFAHIDEKGKEYLALHDAVTPVVPDKIPQIKLKELKKVIKEKYNHTVPADTDIDPEGERLAGRYAKEEFDSDFIFVTHYPWKDKPFYTMPSDDKQDETEGFDLIFRGTELVTGSQRINKYEDLIANMEKKGVKPKGMEFYLETFKFGMPPHGGWGLGSERLIQQLLGLSSIKEATLFPRDVKRLVP